MARGHIYGTLLCLCVMVIIRADNEKVKDKHHSIEIVDNDPEFLVGVKGIDNPLCFHIDGSQNQVVRLLQDPLSGVIVNARIFHDHLTNKTYLGAILISQGNLRIIAKQRLVLFNEAKLDWAPVRTEIFQGSRIVVGNDMVAVTFRKKNITLVVRRHVVTPANEIHYEDGDGALHVGQDQDNSGEERTNVIDSKSVLSSGSRHRADVMPVFGNPEGDSFLNRALSSKRRRGLILQNIFGMNDDEAFVRNVVVEVDSQGRQRRAAKHNNFFDLRNNKKMFALHQTRQNRRKETASENRQHSPTAFHELLTKINNNSNRRVKPHDHRELRAKKQPHESHYQHKGRYQQPQGRHQRNADDDYTVDENPTSEDVEKKRDQTIYLGLYIADSRDLSNRTHGLLGQFLFKKVLPEKIQQKGGKRIVYLLVQGIPIRRTVAIVTSRHNMALNVTRACLKIRDQGREVIDGMYSDYLVPNIRYVSLKELPPL
uniref:Inter-alpha-trypsin inhibitor heavy chain C-terminal domain-containing protein n=1 Tax=Biomphalaria glabrata TaxID=6526 RepID=A0A2C9M135_BIOGL